MNGNQCAEQQFARGGPVSQEWLASPFYALIQRSQGGENRGGCGAVSNWGRTNGTFPLLSISITREPRTISVLGFQVRGERRSLARDWRSLFLHDRSSRGFLDAEIELFHSTLPELSLAMKAHAGHDIASGLLRTYLGYDAGARVHSGGVERGTVNGLHSVLWYADLRGFTRISDVTPGAQIVDTPERDL